MLSALTASMAFLAAVSYFDVPVKPEEYGLRPAHGAVLNVTPAPFVWRPLSTNAVGSYRLIYWKQGGWKDVVTVSGLVHNVYCPAKTMAPGKWNWRVCGERRKAIRAAAKRAFKGVYGEAEIDKWLEVFCRRLVTQAFKRNCAPDGIKVFPAYFGPDDWHIPSDTPYTGDIPCSRKRS